MILQTATLSACVIHKNLLELMFRGCSHDCQQEIYSAVFDTTARKGTQVVGDLLNRHFIAQLIYTRIFFIFIHLNLSSQSTGLMAFDCSVTSLLPLSTLSRFSIHIAC